jgi:hypothetical protein
MSPAALVVFAGSEEKCVVVAPAAVALVVLVAASVVASDVVVAGVFAAPDVVAVVRGECSSGVPRMLSGAAAEAPSTAGE